MKFVFISLVLFILFAGSAFSAQDSLDINEIRLIINEATEASEERMQKSIEALDARMQKSIEASEERTQKYISQEISKVNIRISEMDKRLSNSISEMDKRLSNSILELDKRLNTLSSVVIALMALIAVMIGLPQIIALLQQRSKNKQFAEQQKQIEALKVEHQKEIDALKQAMETLQTGTER